MCRWSQTTFSHIVPLAVADKYHPSLTVRCIFLSFLLFLLYFLFIFMLEKNDGMMEQCKRVCAYVQPQSRPLPGGFQNKAPRVFSNLTSKYYFKEYRPQCSEKLYLWDFVCQESQSAGQPKKKKGRKKKDCHVASLWPTL